MLPYDKGDLLWDFDFIVTSYIHIYLHMYKYMNTYSYTYTYIYIYIHIHIHIYIYIHIHIHIWISIHIPIYIYIYMYLSRFVVHTTSGLAWIDLTSISDHLQKWTRLDRSQFAFKCSHSDRFWLKSISDRSNMLAIPPSDSVVGVFV